MEGNNEEICSEHQKKLVIKEEKLDQVTEDQIGETENIKDPLDSVLKEDPFAYLDREDFTSEKYKIEVRNLPKHYGIAVSKI